MVTEFRNLLLTADLWGYPFLLFGDNLLCDIKSRCSQLLDSTVRVCASSLGPASSVRQAQVLDARVASGQSRGLIGGFTGLMHVLGTKTRARAMYERARTAHVLGLREARCEAEPRGLYLGLM